jgi:hypothetical protein
MIDDSVLRYINSTVECIGNLVKRISRSEGKLDISTKGIQEVIRGIERGWGATDCKLRLKSVLKEVEEHGKDKTEKVD